MKANNWIASVALAATGQDDDGRPDDTVGATRQLPAESKPLILAGFVEFSIASGAGKIRQ